MAYIRKGSRGLKVKSLRQQYNYYVRRAQERVIWQQTFAEASGRKLQEEEYKLFTPKTYDELFEKGITRKIGDVTVRYEGAEAIRVKIQSLKRYASKSTRAQAYIDNYIRAMSEVGFNYEEREEVRKLLSSLSTDRLTFLIHEPPPFGIPEIAYVYSEESKAELIERLRQSIKYSKSPAGRQRLREIQGKTRMLLDINKQKTKIIEGERFM